MQKITKQEEVAYYAPSVQDVIALLPLMDSICESRAYFIRNLENDKDENGYNHKELAKKEEELRILLSMGFIPSSPSMLQNFPTTFNPEV